MQRLGAFLVVALLVAACGGGTPTSGARTSTGDGAPPSASQAQPSATPPPGDTSPEPTATPTAHATPTRLPSPTPHGTAVCLFPLGLPTNAGATQVAVIADVRAAEHVADGYDRIVFEFRGSTYPTVAITVVNPPFAHDGSGAPFTVTGTKYLQIRLSLATASGGYSGPTTLNVNGGKLQQLVEAGDMESVVTWIAGLKSDACVHLSTLPADSTHGARVVIDIAVP